MIKDSRKAIENYLHAMREILCLSPKSEIDRSDEVKLIATTLDRLATQRKNKEAAHFADVDTDSLQQASKYIDLALKTFQEAKSPILSKVQYMNFIIVLGETYEHLANYEAALTNYRDALALAQGLQDSSRQGQIEYRLGRIESDRGNWQSAEGLLGSAIDKLQLTGNHSEAILSEIELAKIAYRKGEYEKAEDIFEDALQKTSSVSDIRSKAVVANHLGIIRRMQGDHESSFRHFQAALIDFQTIQDQHGAAECMNNLGVVHLHRNEMDEAGHYFEKAHQLCQEVANFPLLAFVYSNKAEMYTKVGDLAMAVNTCARALEYVVALENPIGVAKANVLLARIFWQSGDVATAEIFFQQSVGLYQQFSVPLGLANCYKTYADMLATQGRGSEAKAMEIKSRKLFEKLRIEDNLAKSPVRSSEVSPGIKRQRQESIGAAA